MTSLVHMLRHRAISRPDGLAITHLDGDREESSSYAGLDAAARAIAACLQKKMARGERALLLYPPGREFVEAFFGCLYAGMVAVPTFPPDPARLARTLPRIHAIVRDARPTVALTTSALLGAAEAIAGDAPELRSMQWMATDACPPSDAQRWQDPVLADADVAFLQYTSGSTGDPKGVVLTHKNLLHNLEVIREGMGVGPESVCVNWLPPYHDMGLIGAILEPLYVGARSVLISPIAFLQRPMVWLEAIARHRGTIAGGPNFGFDLCVRKSTADELVRLDLSSWQVAFCGAEPIRAETLRRFADHFAKSGFRHEAFLPCYGLAEATLMVAGARLTAAPVIRPFEEASLRRGRGIEASGDAATRTLVSSGRISSALDALVVDPERAVACAPGEIGEIWVRGASVARGYWNRTKDTARDFGARLADSDQGPYLRTGDLGFVLDEELFIAGRRKDVVIVRGRKHYPQDIESTVEQSHPVLRRGACAAFAIDTGGEERLVVVQELERGAAADAVPDAVRAIRRAVAEGHELHVDSIALVRHGSIFKTSSGKIQRSACRDAFLARNLESIFCDGSDSRLERTPDAQQVSALERDIAAELAPALRISYSGFDGQTPLVECGMDSMAAIDIQHRVKSRWDIQLPLAYLLGDATVADMAARIAAQSANSAAPALAKTSSARGEYSLSHGQRAQWLLHQLDPADTSAHIVFGMRIVGGLDIASMRRAWDGVVARHASLRTVYDVRDGEPLQRVREGAHRSLAVVDASHWDEETLRARAEADAYVPFDLLRGPIFRVTLYTRPGENVLTLAMHHIGADLWSVVVLFQDLLALYRAECDGTPAGLQPLNAEYVDFVSWQRNLIEGEDGIRLWNYWCAQLDALEEPALPFLRPQESARRVHVAASHAFDIEPRLASKLRELAAREGATLYVVLLAAFHALLHRYTGQRDIAIGSPAAGRSRGELSDVVGYFVNPMVLRARFDADTTFLSLVRAMRKTVSAALDHQEFPFSVLVERMRPSRRDDRTPLFRSAFVFQKPHRLQPAAPLVLGHGQRGIELSGLALEPFPMAARNAIFDLTVSMIEVGDALEGSFQIDTGTLDPRAAGELARHFAVLLESIAEDPSAPVARLPLVTPAEPGEARSWNALARNEWTFSSVVEQFERQAQLRPDAVAVVDAGSRSITYRELAERAGRLARHLRELGVTTDARVGICLDRSIDMVVAAVGILKAGGAYVALDPKYPKERIAAMLAATGTGRDVPVVVSDRAHASRAGGAARHIALLDELPAEGNASALSKYDIRESSLAYVIFTSGSTGKPKAVGVSHRALANYIGHNERVFGFGASDRILQFASASFDVSNSDLWGALCLGGTLVLVADENRMSPAAVADQCRAERVTVMNPPTALWHAWVAELASAGVPESLRLVLFGGEAVQRESVRQWIRRVGPTPRLVNLYGPTETTISAMMADISGEPEGEVPIGHPVSNTAVWVLDAHGQLLPPGAPGELWIGGDGLARGYLNDAAMTAERFVPDDFGPAGSRMYRTGDVVRRRVDGEIDFVGRADQQIKLRGFRIELGEVEAALRAHGDVTACAARVREDRPGSKRLVAYVVLREGAHADRENLREHLERTLPDYMIPSAFVPMDALPLTRNGKIDTSALPAPEEDESRDSYVAPRSASEEIVAQQWGELLGLTRVGVRDDFFALGGHSLLATQVISRLRAAFGVELPLRALFEARTIERLCARMDATARKDASACAPLGRVERTAPLPLSFAQQRLWFLDRLDPNSAAYNMPAALRLRGKLDAAALGRTFVEVLRRHEVLRTTFAVRDGEPIQVIHETPEGAGWHFVQEDLSGLPGEARDEHVERRVEEEAKKPFDLERGPSLRTILLRVEPEEHVLLVTMHHVVSDGWSIGLLVREIGAIYGAFARGEESPLKELPVQYADFAVWQRAAMEHPGGARLEQQLTYWRNRLDGAAALELPADRPRPPSPSYIGGHADFAASGELTAALKSLSERHGVTLFMTLLAAFQAFLSRYGAQDDICVGVPIANRQHKDLESLIGFFVNTLVLRGDLSDSPTLVELLARTKDAALGAYAHQDVPFEMVVDAMGVPRDLSRTPLFQVMFSLQNGNVCELRLGELALSRITRGQRTTKFDLTLDLVEGGGRIIGQWEYREDLFDRASVERMSKEFGTFVQAWAADPQLRSSEVPLLSPAERAAMIAWNAAARSEWTFASVVDRFEQHAKDTPDAVAVIAADGRCVTYRELSVRADCLARHLADLGVTVETRVGICLDRSIEMVVAVVGILKAGASCVALDPNYPAERLEAMMAATGARVVVSDRAHAGHVERVERAKRHIVLVEELSKAQKSPARTNGAFASRTAESSLAYVIFTSGSTGTPKAVGISHRALANYITHGERVFGFGPSDRMLQFASLSFDVSNSDIWWMLALGGTLVLVADENRMAPVALMHQCRAERVTVMNPPTAMWHAWVSELETAGVPESMRLVLFGGEAAQRESVRKWIRHVGPRTRLINLYGPTETTISALMADLADEPRGEVPIGHPVNNTTAWVLDSHGQLVPPGVPGELWIGGDCLGRGYLNDAAMTAARFVPNVFGPAGSRLYRSGDVVRRRADSEVEFVGRADQQIKLRGFRIELGEVESAVRTHEGVVACAVCVREDHPGTKRLVAYVVWRSGEAHVRDLREHVKRTLPEYMVPSAFVSVDALPLTKNGKVDKRALPAPKEEDAGAQYMAPRTPAEEIVAQQWAALLGLERVGTRDDFFELGGHSLLATRVVSRLHATFGVELPLRAVFEAPTVEGLCARIATASRSESKGPALVRAGRNAPLPLSFAQERLWVLNRMEPNDRAYHVPAALRLQGTLNVPVLERTFREVMQRHEALRTTFALHAGKPVQIVHESPEATGWRFAREDLSAHTPEAREEEIAQRMREDAEAPFDLACGPLLRTTLLRLGTQEHLLLVTMHHIVSDAWSIGVFIHEVRDIYAAFARGDDAPRAELPIQYGDFAVWQRARLEGSSGVYLEQQLAYWKEQLAGAVALALPADRPRSKLASYRGGHIEFALSKKTTAALKALSQRRDVTLFMTLLAAFHAFLSRYSGQEDICVGVPIANRQHEALETLIGFFVNTLVLRGDLSGDPTFIELLGRTRETAMAAYAHQDAPFEKVVDALGVPRDPSRSPLFQVMFSLQNASIGELALEGLTLQRVTHDRQTTHFDLTVDLAERDGQIRGQWEYSADRFDRTTVERMLAGFTTMLEAWLADPDLRTRRVPLLPAGERLELLEGWNATDAKHGDRACIHELFEAQVERTPDAVAVVFGEEQLTYRGLNERANELAHHLQSLGVGPETMVGICAPRSIAMVVALLGILKAGGAYIPLDPNYPKERLELMIRDSGARTVLTEEVLTGLLRKRGERRRKITAPVSSDHLAYGIYTSGSTGVPKCTGITHRALVNHMQWIADRWPLADDDVVLQKTSVAFDASVWEFYAPLLRGARLVMARPGDEKDPQLLARALKEHDVTVLQVVPSMLELLVEQPALVRATSLKRLYCGGEALRRALASRAAERTAAEVINLYGPAEATIDTTYWVWDGGNQDGGAPIGRPIENAKVYVLDTHLEPVPIGVTGELYISGAGLGRGYVHRAGLTADKYIPAPYGGAGARMYRSGDAARWNALGELEFVGRIDDQVKVRGHRVEPREIELVLSDYPSVRESLVQWRESGEGRLVAYVIMDDGAEMPRVEDLRAHLGRKLPEYMIPPAYVQLTSWPRSPNGKLDRAALPDPDGRRPEQERAFMAARTPVEEALAGIWAEVLGVSYVGIHDDFFALGGHSLLATQVISRLHSAFAIDLPVHALFEAPTVATLAQHVDTAIQSRGDAHSEESYEEFEP